MSSDYDFIGLSKASVFTLLDPGQLTTLRPKDVYTSLGVTPDQMFYAYGLAKADDFNQHLPGLGAVNSLEIAKKVNNTNELKSHLLQMTFKNSETKRFKERDVVAMVNEIRQMVNVFNTRNCYCAKIQKNSCCLMIQKKLKWMLIMTKKLL